MDKMLEQLAEQSTELSMEAWASNRLLIGSLVMYLVDKGIIDHADYVQHTNKVRDHLLLNREFSNDREQNLVTGTFDTHLSDITQPD
ncbi:hypothetical protein [Acinetobacter nosocomialis]|uniref:hypothetical protein n=1 Tax=Acinetobacter nosocomialis TaxID=106654 RepID=UPI001A9AA6C4|nr:hypothetical protein [Acinetobacter nosocomialis]MBO1280970.1 hypothetical protein [Acinetobacter nosocomialis]